MNDRQLRALTDPLDHFGQHAKVADRRSIRQRGDGTLLVVILAVDR